MLNINDVANLVLTVTFVATFIGIFFFTYASTVEREIVIKQVNYITTDITSLLKTNLDPEYKTLLKQVLANMQAPDMKVIDEQVKQSNDELMKKAFKILGTLLVGGLFAAYYLSSTYGLDFYDLLTKNLVMLVFIGIVEFVFITYFATQFISADPNYVKTVILQTLQEFSKKQ